MLHDHKKNFEIMAPYRCISLKERTNVMKGLVFVQVDPLITSSSPPNLVRNVRNDEEFLPFIKKKWNNVIAHPNF